MILFAFVASASAIYALTFIADRAHPAALTNTAKRGGNQGGNSNNHGRVVR